MTSEAQAMSTSPRQTEVSLTDFTGTLVLVGAGKMGGALLEGWSRLGLDLARVAVIEPLPSREIADLAARGLRLNAAMNLVHGPTAVVIAVKPQNAAEIMPLLAPVVGPGTVVLSIMAGKTLGFLAEGLPPRTAVVRSMPNTPAAIGRGITVAVPNPHVSAAQRDLAHKLLAATGGVEWVDQEALLDPVTALSGSGPAYGFLLAESLARAGGGGGPRSDRAARLARATVAGSGELWHRSPLDAAPRRQNVPPRGGPPAAALDVLRGEEGIARLRGNGVAAATRRSR